MGQSLQYSLHGSKKLYTNHYIVIKYTAKLESVLQQHKIKLNTLFGKPAAKVANEEKPSYKTYRPHKH